MEYAEFVTQVVNQFQFPLSLEVIIEYCRQHEKKVVVFLVDELLKITNGKDPAPIHDALTALGRVSQHYTSSTECLVMGIASSLVCGTVLKWQTHFQRNIIWCGLNLFSKLTMNSVFQPCSIVNTSRFQNVMFNTSGHPKSTSQLIRYIRDKAINTEEDLWGHYVDILQQLQPKDLPENELNTVLFEVLVTHVDKMLGRASQVCDVPEFCDSEGGPTWHPASLEFPLDSPTIRNIPIHT